jgi:DNA-directed RNA polymerase subunit RPC12/RpoP
MNEEMRTFGYLCPKCGKTVMAARSVFALEASNAEIECECGESALKVDFDGEKYQVYVPCGLCGETHMAHCPPERILHGATALGCAKTKQFCCFIGPEGTVEKNLRELAVLAEKEKQQKDDGQEAFVDNVIMYEVLSELKEIAARPNGITCGCGSVHYGMEIRRSSVDLVCRDCGAKLRIPAATDRDLDDLCCHMKLAIPGK